MTCLRLVAATMSDEEALERGQRYAVAAGQSHHGAEAGLAIRAAFDLGHRGQRHAAGRVAVQLARAADIDLAHVAGQSHGRKVFMAFGLRISGLTRHSSFGFRH